MADLTLLNVTIALRLPCDVYDWIQSLLDRELYESYTPDPPIPEAIKAAPLFGSQYWRILFNPSGGMDDLDLVNEVSSTITRQADLSILQLRTAIADRDDTIAKLLALLSTYAVAPEGSRVGKCVNMTHDYGADVVWEHGRLYLTNEAACYWRDVCAPFPLATTD